MEGTTIADLPTAAVQEIISKARIRKIGGTNSLARVCKCWSTASIEEDQEQLCLYMDVSEVSKEQLANALEWAGPHGQQVVGVDLADTIIHWRNPQQGDVVQQLFGAAALSASLTRLTFTVGGASDNTLVELMLLGIQLPSLRHLQAAVDMDDDVWSDPELVLAQEQLPAGTPPPMQLLFPALTSLTLDLVRAYGSYHDGAGSEDGSDDGDRTAYFTPEELLPVLLPRTLQRLQLCALDVNIAGQEPGMHVEECLSPLTQLSHLGLAFFMLTGPGLPPSVQQLHLDHCNLSRLRSWEPYAAKMVQLGEVTNEQLQEWLGHGGLQQLTALRWRIDVDSETPEEVQQQQVQALHQLKGLRSFELDCVFHAGAAIQQLSSLTGLRQLTVGGTETAEILMAIGKLTQLTGLDLGGLAERIYSVEEWNQQPMVVHFDAMLQQLTGLRQLSVPEHMLEHPGPWLPCLTQLTLLGFGLMGRTEVSYWWEDASSNRLRQWLEAKPRTLQHLVLYVFHTCQTPIGAALGHAWLERDALAYGSWQQLAPNTHQDASALPSPPRHYGGAGGVRQPGSGVAVRQVVRGAWSCKNAVLSGGMCCRLAGCV